MGDVPSPAEVIGGVGMSLLVECPLGRIWHKGQDGCGCGAEGDGGDIVHGTDADA